MGSLDLKGLLLSSSSSAEDDGIAKRLWNKFKNQRALALYSPYAVSLASGTLDPKSFLDCVSQDAYFLQAYAQAYESAEDYADDDDDKDAITKLRKRVLKRLKNQEMRVREWGFELPEQSACSEATAKYMDFLKETAAGKVGGEKFAVNIVTPFEKTKLAAYTLSAVSPCMRLYSFISREIQALLDPEESHVYKKWLDSLSSQEFEASASRIEDLLDKLSITLTGEELDVVERLYHRAMELEIGFICSQSVAQPTIVPLSRLDSIVGENFLLFCDFDLTCTTVDSSAVLAELAIVAAADNCGSDIRTTWTSLYSEYIEEYQQCIEGITTSDKDSEGFDYDGLCKSLEKISDLEKKANSRMIQSNVLKGLGLVDINRAGERIAFQDGCKEFFQDVESKNCAAEVHVLSSCWSGDLMTAAFSSGELKNLNIHSNNLAYEDSISTGDMFRKMECPSDKLQVYNEITKCNLEGKTPFTVYIGGSVGDLLCLLEADIGIVIGLTTSLLKLGNHFGVSFVPLFSGLVSKQRELAESGTLNRKGRSSILYTVSNWDEIYAFVLGQ